MDYRKEYEAWLNNEHIDAGTKEELKKIAGDEKEIEDRFYTNLRFGTGGMRGVIGAGTNRMNKYVVGRATQGLANYILKEESQGASVVIAHDSRHRSREFAERAALVLAANGIKAYLFPELKPTPLLSYAVRYLKCTAGIVITASHNPPEYNGYKVYWRDGGQIVPSLANKIIAEIEKVADFNQVKVMEKAEAESAGLLTVLGDDVEASYMKEAEDLINGLSPAGPHRESLKIVYTPLHGTGNEPVRRLLQELGFSQVQVVEEQAKPDPEFSTVDSPNPEEQSAFKLALQLAEREKADLAVATDPDADRVGVFVRHEGQYHGLNGNQTGALLLHYILSHYQADGGLPANPAVVKTIVTSELGARIARDYGVEVYNTLTGFKYIGEKINEFETSGKHKFLFGWEESYGYLAGTFARDKDAVSTTALICSMAADYKAEGKTLFEVLEQVYEQYGYFREDLETITLKGVEGAETIKAIMADLRANSPSEVAGRAVVSISDYQSGIKTKLASGRQSRLDLPEENVLYFAIEGDSWFCVRPSGTEPKLKIYFSAVDSSREAAEEYLKTMKTEVMTRVEGIIRPAVR